MPRPLFVLPALLCWAASSFGQSNLTVQFNFTSPTENHGRGFSLLVEGAQVQQLTLPKDTLLTFPVGQLPTLGYFTYAENPRFLNQFYFIGDTVTIQGDLTNPSSWHVWPRHPQQALLDSIFHYRDDSLTLTLLSAHPDIPTASRLLLGLLKNGLPHERAKEVYAQLPNNRRNDYYGNQINALLSHQGSAVANVGDQYIDVEAYDVAGNAHHLSEYMDGKYLLLDISAMGCNPCSRAVPELSQIHQTYGDQITVVSLWSATSREVWQRAVHRNFEDTIEWPDLWDQLGEGTTRYAVKAYPTYFLISPTGLIMKTWSGYGKGGLLKKLLPILAPSNLTEKAPALPSIILKN